METEEGVDLEREIQNAGYLSMDSFIDLKYHAYMGLRKFGDPFMHSLGTALMSANLKDAKKLMRYWQQECEQYALLYKMYLAKEKAINNV